MPDRSDLGFDCSANLERLLRLMPPCSIIAPPTAGEGRHVGRVHAARRKLAIVQAVGMHRTQSSDHFRHISPKSAMPPLAGYGWRRVGAVRRGRLGPAESGPTAGSAKVGTARFPTIPAENADPHLAHAAFGRLGGVRAFATGSTKVRIPFPLVYPDLRSPVV
jgi:hypothetical protein